MTTENEKEAKHLANISIEAVDQCLPQTQCTQCDYPRCRDYAEAILNGQADINQCPPGGSVTIHALAELLDTPVKPLNTDHGHTESKQVARIEENACIGCKLCIKACPVDCIVGAGKVMHTVIQYDCTGCKLCLPVCPTDCIQLIGAPEIANEAVSPWGDFSQNQVTRSRWLTAQKIARVARREQQRKERHQVSAKERMKKEIMMAVKRQAQKSKQTS